MFSDIAGYTAIMGRDEDEALCALDAHRELLRALMPKFNGRIVGEIGDGTLTSFHSAIEAVNCAREVQASLQDRPEFKVRIGIHLGDVVFSNNTVLGDGVNVASRIHALAPPGGICVSSNVYDEVRNKPGSRLKDLGEQRLKNVSRPIRVYQIVGSDLGAKPAEASGGRRWVAIIAGSGAAILAGLILFFVRMSSPAPSGPVQVDLSPLLRPIRDQYEVPGLVAAVLQGERVTASGSVGVRKIGTSEPISVTDQVHLGSCTKAMTAVLIGTLIDDRQLDWNSRLAEIFPELVARMNPRFRSATIRQLLDETAGFPPNLDWWAIDRTGGSLVSERRLAVEQAVSVASVKATGTGYLYSNLDYVVLGAVLEKKTGQAWEDLMRKRLFEPLGMATAGFGPPGTKGLVDAPWGHRVTDGRVEPSQTDNPPVFGPAGTVHCSIDDWARFVSLYLQSGSQTLLSPRTLWTLITPGPGLDYAGGWIVTSRDWGGGTVMTVTGSNTYWVSAVWVAPRKNFAILVSTNIGNDRFVKMSDDVVWKILQSGQLAGLLESASSH